MTGPSGLGTALNAVYASRACPTDKQVLIAIAHATRDWSDMTSARPVAVSIIASNTGYAISTVTLSLRRLTEGGVLRSKRTPFTSLRTIDWSKLESYESSDERKCKAKRAPKPRPAPAQPVDNSGDNPVDDGGKPGRISNYDRGADTDSRHSGYRTTDERIPNYDGADIGSRYHMSSLRPPDGPSTAVEKNAREDDDPPEVTADHPPAAAPAPPPPEPSPAPRAVEARPSAGAATSFSRTAPPWLLRSAVQHRVPPVELGAMVVHAGRRLSRDGELGLQNMQADGPTLLAFWGEIGAPEPSAFSQDLALVAEAFHLCPEPIFARYVRAQGVEDRFPNRESSMRELCNRSAWQDRLAAARLWNQRGRPLVRDHENGKSGANAVTRRPGAGKDRS